jgi:trehalose synthase
MVTLLRDEPRARALGASGRERVRQHFLIPRLALDELSLMRRLVAGTPAGRAFEWLSRRDPVCGMAICAGPHQTTTVGGVTLSFCSTECRDKFAAAPERYLGRPASAPEPADAHAAT